MIDHAGKHNTITIKPPKGANNQWWAEQTYKALTARNVPCLIVRSGAAHDNHSPDHPPAHITTPLNGEDILRQVTEINGRYK